MGYRGLIAEIAGDEAARKYRFSEDEFIQDLIGVTRLRESKVGDRVLYTLMCRYKMKGHRFKTFDEIAWEYRVTRETVRQSVCRATHALDRYCRTTQNFLRENTRARERPLPEILALASHLAYQGRAQKFEDLHLASQRDYIQRAVLAAKVYESATKNKC